MYNQNITHVGFTDESNWNNGQIRSISFVSCKVEYVEELNIQLNESLKTSGVCEFKWKKLQSAKYRFAAEKIFKTIVKHANAGKLRVDTLVWDTHDRRHNLKKRDDIENMHRMFYHLIGNVIQYRWSKKANWHIFPDQMNEMNWAELKYYLEKKPYPHQKQKNYISELYSANNMEKYFITNIQPCLSHETHLIQVADLFAGIAVFSRQNTVEYSKWEHQNSNQLELFEKPPYTTFTNTQQERFPVIRYFKELCKQNKLGVDHVSKKGFITHQPRNSVNFWHYEPQHAKDIAPTR